MRERIEIGDWSNDGHGQSDTMLIEVPRGVDTKDAYERGEKIVGFKLNDFCKGYEDSSFPVENLKTVVDKAEELNLPIDFDDFEIIDEEGYNFVQLSIDSYFIIWLTILNIGIVADRGLGRSGRLAYEVVEDDNIPVHHIGGYGLYSCY